MSLVSRSVSSSVLGVHPTVPRRCAAWSATALALACALAAPACDSPAQKPATDGGTGGAGGAASAPIETNAAAPTGMAIISSNYEVTSIALVDSAGTVHDDCVHSGATSANMTQDLSGDATLSTQAQHRGELAVIDRKNATITYVDPAGCVPRLQFSVSTGGLKSNPHDVISLSTDKAYVTRYEKNLAPTAAADDFDDGDDIVIVDVKTGKITGSIPLSAQVPPGSDASVQARPDRGVLADGKVYVTLGALGPLDVLAVAAGPGRVVVIDPKSDTVTGTIDLPTLKGCSGIDYRQATKKLYVSCGGSFSDGAEQAKKSALVEIDVSGATPEVTHILTADDLGGQPINFSYAAVLDDVAYVGTLGSFPDATGAPGSADTFLGVALSGGAPAKLKEGGAYNFGHAGVDAVHKRIYLPEGDATKPRVHVFDASVSPAALSTSFEANPAGHLPPREAIGY